MSAQSRVRSEMPEIRDIEQLRSFPQPMRKFLAEACEEEPTFLPDYLMPTLGRDDAYEVIFTDLSNAITDQELAQLGLGEFGDLGKSIFKKIGKAVKKVAKVVGKATGVKQLEKVAKVQQKIEKKVVKGAEKVYRKYGDVIVSAVGAVLTPFTFGLSNVAAGVITAAHKMYQNKKLAEKAKKQNNAQAGALAAQAQASEAQTQQQVDGFYNQNQAWFASQGIGQDQWNGMSLDQKINTINSGASGSLTHVADSPQAQPAPGSLPPSSGSGVPGGGGAPGGGGGGGAPGGSSDGGADFGFGPSSQPSQQQGARQPVSTASMTGDMSSMLIPAAIITAAVIFSSSPSGSRRTRRNPARSRRSGAWRGKRRHPRRRW